MPRLVTVASCALNQTAMDFEGNLKRILGSCREARERGAKIRSGPELEITGYGCGDHFLELDTFQHSWEVLHEILKSEDCKDLLCDIGMPVLHRGSRYNCRVFIWNGTILLIRPKIYLADGGNYRESRWFNSWSQPGQINDHKLPTFMQEIQRSAPFGDAILAFEDTTIGVEICEELFAPMSPHLGLALMGNVEIFLNGSASHHELGKLGKRFSLVLGATSKAGGLYLYSNQMGCDGDRLYFDGSAMISLNGKLLAQSPQFSVKEIEIVTATVDLDLIQISRGNCSSFANQAANCKKIFPFEYARIEIIGVRLCHHDNLNHISVSPFIEPFYHPEEMEICLGPALWMWDYLRKCGGVGFFIPLSGGLDSCSCALIVYSMTQFLTENGNCLIPHVRNDLINVLDLKNESKEVIEKIICDPKKLMNRLLYTCYFGTENSTESSRLRALNLSEAINSNHATYYIDGIIKSITSLFIKICGLGNYLPKYQSAGGSQQEDLALQNLQSRLRLILSYFYAQLVVAIRKRTGPLLIVATGNADEGLSGYFTKYDCSSGDLNPIGSICKNDLRKFVKYFMKKNENEIDDSILKSIYEAVPTAELKPQTGEDQQADETEMGITYEELNNFGKLRLMNRYGPYSMFNHLRTSNPVISAAYQLSRVAFFFKKYATNRHKMTILPPTYHGTEYNSDDHGFDVRPFLYGQWTWQWQLKRIERDIDELVI